jgi:hypothetical protein
METQSGNEYGPLYDCWNEMILDIVQRIQHELGQIEIPESTSRTVLRCKLIDLRNMIMLSRNRDFWKTSLPRIVDQEMDLLCGEEAWALWWVRHLSMLAADVRRQTKNHSGLFKKEEISRSSTFS